MGWAVGYMNHRDIGYGVPAICDHPDCDVEIDRGLAYCCGDEPWGDVGCHLYFCGEHLGYSGIFDSEGNQIDPDAEEEKAEEDGVEVDDSDWSYVDLCERCHDNLPPFPMKADTLEWVWWKLNAPSWAKWRAEESDIDLLLMAARVVEGGFTPSESNLSDLTGDE